VPLGRARQGSDSVWMQTGIIKTVRDGGTPESNARSEMQPMETRKKATEKHAGRCSWRKVDSLCGGPAESAAFASR